jgi:hypothetical protein
MGEELASPFSSNEPKWPETEADCYLAISQSLAIEAKARATEAKAKSQREQNLATRGTIGNAALVLLLALVLPLAIAAVVGQLHHPTLGPLAGATSAALGLGGGVVGATWKRGLADPEFQRRESSSAAEARPLR